MSVIKIETITPVHVGSGTILQNNTDFAVVQHGEESDIGIIDDRKILKLIGEDNIDKWVSSIERKENIKEFLSRFAPSAALKDYSKRIIANYGDVNTNDTLKECIHSGLGMPYIPGSSIKGAIRTAIVATLASKLQNVNIGFGNRINAKALEQDLFGKNVNEDLFRFIQVGDAYFNEGVEISTRLVNINIRAKKEFWDDSKSQLIEAISAGQNCNFQLKVLSDYHEWAKNQRIDRFTLKNLSDEMNSIPNLFNTINQHTQRLIEEELEFWTVYKEDDSVKEYLDRMNEMLNETVKCKSGNSCILRIGHASGWRFITGAWTEKLRNFRTDVIPASRRNNDRYAEYPFPKSRRLDEYGDLLGFVKLKI